MYTKYVKTEQLYYTLSIFFGSSWVLLNSDIMNSSSKFIILKLCHFQNSMPSLKLVVLIDVIPFFLSAYASQSCNGTLFFNETEVKLFDLVVLARVLVIVSFYFSLSKGKALTSNQENHHLTEQRIKIWKSLGRCWRQQENLKHKWDIWFSDKCNNSKEPLETKMEHNARIRY